MLQRLSTSGWTPRTPAGLHSWLPAAGMDGGSCGSLNVLQVAFGQTTELEPGREASSQPWAGQVLDHISGSGHTQLWMGIPLGREGRDSSLPWRNEPGPAGHFSVMNL